MRNEDLMVGDWFRFRYMVDSKEIVKTFRISRIENELGKYYVWSNESGRMCVPERLEPILLTLEILEKNGFEKDDGGEECWGCDAGWVIPGEYDECGKEKSWQVEILGEPNSFTGTIHFVHELQHALRLCGIDKTIEV